LEHWEFVSKGWVRFDEKWNLSNFLGDKRLKWLYDTSDVLRISWVIWDGWHVTRDSGRPRSDLVLDAKCIVCGNLGNLFF
jgi:hypothetical protein